MNQSFENTTISLAQPLPTGFRVQDFLQFHRRDAKSVAERVNGNLLEKGLVWRGRPACLKICFQAQTAQASLLIDGIHENTDSGDFQPLVQRMLGLNQNIETFEAQYCEHPQLMPLIRANLGLRVPVAASPFEALTWAITGQQISVHAATSLRRQLIQTAACRHSSGLFCYPDARRIAHLNIEDLRHAGFSQTKAQAILTLSRMVHEQQLPLEDWIVDEPPVDEIRERLLQVRGIGPWTVNYALMRGYGWLDGSLHGDAAVRRGLQTLLGEPEQISAEQTRQWLAAFSPWRALVAAHLWAWNTKSADVVENDAD